MLNKEGLLLCFVACCALSNGPILASTEVTQVIGKSTTKFYSTNPNTTRIVGGVWAKRGAYPFQSAVLVDSIFNCGGTLLRTRKHILTAAHCLTLPKLSAENLTIYLHTTVINPPDPAYYERKASRFVIHPEYNETVFANDIAIITLTEPVPFIRTVRLEPAEKASINYAGVEATVIGWGRTRQILHPNISFGPNSNHLRQVNITIVSPADCAIFYYSEGSFSDGRRICAATVNGKGICQGDSGGPIFIDGYQVGINSAAAGCADPRFPSIFTRIAPYRSWISENTRSPGPKPTKPNNRPTHL